MRYSSYTRGDTTGFITGDDRWTGIDSTRDRDKIAPGRLYKGENTRLRTGTIRQRGGTQIPSDFNPTGGFTNSIIGSGIFRDPNGDEALLVAPAGETFIVALRFGKDPVQINYGSTAIGTNGTGLVEFVQGFDSLIMLRIPSQGDQNLVWNGNYNQASDANKLLAVELTSEGDTLVPPMWHGEPFGDRIIFYQAFYPTAPQRDTWLITDFYDYSSYYPAYQTFRTNAGESDIIVRIMQYFRNSVVVFKNNSIHMASDLGTYPTTFGQRELSGTIGAVGNKTEIEVGGDILFPSQPNGFYRLSEVIADQIVTLPLPISEPIQKVIDGINWPYTALWGSSAALDNYAFFGVCHGVKAQRLNRILVYNTQSKEWESQGDTWADPQFAFNRLHIVNFGGIHRLVAIDYLNGIIYLLYEGIRDELKSGSFAVPFKMETRGYMGDQGGFSRFGRVQLPLATWSPKISVTAIMDGVNEEFPLTDVAITKDSSRYYTHGADPFDPNTGNANAPYREDYSLSDIDDLVIEDFEEYPEGPIDFLPATLFGQVGDMQQTQESFWARQIGRWMSLRVENSDGHVEVQGVTVEGLGALNAVKTAA
jgi:hypothetical protein